MSKYVVAIVTLMILGAGVAAFSVPAGAAGTQTHRLGFWLQDGDALKYPASTFFNAMFLTPPYPSSLEVMIFAIQQDELGHFGCSASTPYVSGAISYWGQVAQLADAYPNIHLIYEIAYDPSSGGSGTYGLGCFNTLVHALAQYPSVYAMGIEGEYTQLSKGLTAAQVVTAMGDVKATGKAFISYYLPTSLVPSGGYLISHTNFPGGDSGGYDQVNTLKNTNSITVGLDSGYYARFNFPGTAKCPIGATAMNAATAGFNQCVVSAELSTAVSMPSASRQFLELDPGFWSGGYFTGVSGRSTNQLWDNPTLRNLIWNDPNYQPNFILSTSVSVPAVVITTTSAVTTSSATTTSQTSATSVVSLVTTVTSTTSTSATSSSASYSISTRIGCPAGVQYCGKVWPPGTGTYGAGSSVTITATAYGGYAFSAWVVCTTTCTSYTSNPLNVILTSDTKATAVFVPG